MHINIHATSRLCVRTRDGATQAQDPHKHRAQSGKYIHVRSSVQPIRSSANVGVATTSTPKLFGRSFARCVSRACGSNEGESLQFDFLFCVGTSSQTHISRSSSSNRSSRVAAQQQQRRATEKRENSLSFEVFGFCVFSLHCWQCVSVYMCVRRTATDDPWVKPNSHRGSKKKLLWKLMHLMRGKRWREKRKFNYNYIARTRDRETERQSATV